MARWTIIRRNRGKEGTRLVYQNTQSVPTQTFDLGGVHSSVPDSLVVDWVFSHAESLCPGDVIVLSDGTMMLYSQKRSVA